MGRKGLTPEERKALKARIQEEKEAQGEKAVLDQVAGWPEPERALALGLHALIRQEAPELTPRLWYGMPAYAREGQVLCFLQPAHKFKTRYATFGFTDQARLDQGEMWPVAFALKNLGPEEEEALRGLLRRALGKA
ncbi:iron chaperone [Thermus igniterrae]|uniref:iron chaperone n=1 Tax=Thermus igniterrae TaxID=88189 RepID=UPI000373873D|nr:DUF1801 domain-containing protein [Thermus igniterrae]